MKDAELLKLIREHFPPHPLDPTRAFDTPAGAYLNIAEFQRDSQGKSWDQLDLQFLRFHYDSLPQLSPSAFTDYLPAFLSITITDRARVDIIPAAVLASLTPHLDDPKTAAQYDQRINALTDQQKMVVTRFIEYLSERETDRSDREHLEKLLQDFSKRYLKGGKVDE
jgi:hypothetical protein